MSPRAPHPILARLAPALTVSDVAAALGVSRTHAARLLERRALPGLDVAARRSRRLWRVSPDDLELFILDRYTGTDK